MKYLSVEEARNLPGLRLVLTAGVPGPWGEAAKAVFGARGVAFAPVEQVAMEANDALVEWTGHRNAPIACLDDEPPRTAWLDIVLLAERLGSGPSLLPDRELDRALCLGLITEIAGTDGLGWNRRQQIMSAYVDGGGADPALGSMAAAYGVTKDAIAQAPGRIAAIIGGLAAQLGDSDYMIGDRLTALDIYWACFSMTMLPLPQAINPMPDWLRKLYSDCDIPVDPRLTAHRDRIYQRHIALPLDY